MAKKKSKSSTPKLVLVTPAGSLCWPKLFKPALNTFNQSYEYSTDIIFQKDDPGVKELVNAVKEFQAEQDAGPRLPFSVDKDAGTIVLKAKSKAVVNGEKRLLPIVDAKKQDITENPNLGNGSLAKLSVAFVPYEQQGGGVTCYLQAVQILRVKEYNPGVDAFDEEEGYEYGPGAGERDDADAGSVNSEGVNDDDLGF